MLLLMVNTGVQAACNVGNHHPENGGYYIEGIAGVNSSQRDNVTGRRADKSAWTANTYYPHGEIKKCTGMFCSAAAKANGTAQYVVAHTCALLRFSYAPSSGSTVYLMPDLNSFTTCDFTNAALVGAADKGTPHFDYPIEDDHAKKVYYFASKDHCADAENAQKLAVEVTDDYANNALQCETMGKGSSRIQHCDCNHQMKGTTLIDPCHTAFVKGCLADMPKSSVQRSCCPRKTASRYSAAGSYNATTGKYVSGGTCVPKSKEQSMKETHNATKDLCAQNATACTQYEALESCPSKYSSSYDPKCNMVKTWKMCNDNMKLGRSASAAVTETCRTDMNWIVTMMMTTTTTTEAAVTMFTGCEDVKSGTSLEKFTDGKPPINEPCYNHVDLCQGYPVCCVKYGTCIALGGSTLSSNLAYYEGGCQSLNSSKKAWDTSENKECKEQGECLAAYLQTSTGGTTKGDKMADVPADHLARIMKGTSWNGKSCSTAAVPATAAATNSAKVSGSFEVAMADASAVLGTTEAKSAFESAMAKEIATAAGNGVLAAHVVVTVSAASSRRLSEGRRLAAGLLVAYTITVPASASKTSVATKIDAKTGADMKTIVNSALATASSSVPALKTVKATGVTIKTTATGTAPAKTSGAGVSDPASSDPASSALKMLPMLCTAIVCMFQFHA
jgi:hypothetical protein